MQKQHVVYGGVNNNKTSKSRKILKKSINKKQISIKDIYAKSRNGKFESKRELSYKIILTALALYLFAFMFWVDTRLILFLLPQAFLVLLMGHTYISPQNLSLSQYASNRDKVFYIFLFWVLISLNLLPASTVDSIANNFNFFPKKILSNYNVYMNYTLITGFLILIIPDVRHKSINWGDLQNNPYYKSKFSKIFFFVILPIPIFGGFTYLLYKYELKENTNTLQQTFLIGCICSMLAYLFIILKNILIKIFSHNYFK